jgi:hypothetical protein
MAVGRVTKATAAGSAAHAVREGLRSASRNSASLVR